MLYSKNISRRFHEDNSWKQIMTTMSLYKALLEANVSEDLAVKAVESLSLPADLVTKAELKDLVTKAELKAELKNLATKEDLRELRRDLDTKATEDLKEMERKIESIFDLKIESSLAKLEAESMWWRMLWGSAIMLIIVVIVLKLI